MRQVLNKSMIVMAAASGILSAAGGYAHADSSADGAAIGSPGVGSGNAVQAPVHIPVNLCGNTVDVIALLNPAFGNTCANVDSGKGKGKGNGAHQSGASAEGAATHSPGVLSGNLIQAPVQVPVNACGNTVDVVGALNPAGGNTCANVSGPDHKPPTEPPTEEPPTGKPPVKEPRPTSRRRSRRPTSPRPTRRRPSRPPSTTVRTVPVRSSPRPARPVSAWQPARAPC